MNNTASLKRTEPAAGSGFDSSRIATVIAALLLTAVVVSFRPFQPEGGAAEGGGDVVNQLGFGSLGAISLLALASFTDRRVLAALASPWWLLMIGFLLLSVFDATSPPAAMRAASFTLIGILAMAAVLSVPRDADAFSTVIAFAAIVVIGLSYAGLVLLPDIARHTGDSLEPQHAGLWRGLFSHKNIAGPVMACFSFAGLYLWRRGWTWLGAAIFFSALIFMANTGSKTTTGLIPLSIVMVMLPGLIGMRLLVPVLFVIAVAGTALATLGIVFIDPIKALANDWFPGLTYTGRTALWAFSGEMIAKQPWAGYGFESFWGTDFLLTMDRPFDIDWDIRGIVHGHNGYLDIAVIMGIPALVAAAITFLIVPLVDYMRVPLRNESVFLADFFMMILLFTALNAFLESFFFRRADPVWLFFVFSVLGLRLVARFPVKAARPRLDGTEARGYEFHNNKKQEIPGERWR